MTISSTSREGTAMDATPTARAVARGVRVTPMKARRLVDVVRGMRAEEAVARLRFAPQAASDPVRKVIESAMANAQQKGLGQRDDLVVAVAYVDEGPTMKRFRPRAQGRAYRIDKRTSHITVEVAAVPEAPARAAGRRGARGGAARTKGGTR